MRDHSSPGALAQALPETAFSTPHRTAEQEKQPPARRRSREELAAAHQRAQARVRGEVQRQMDQERRDLVRQVHHQRLHREKSRTTLMNARPALLPYRLAIPLVALLVFVFGGFWFDMTRGDNFLAAGGATWRAWRPWVVFTALPGWYWVLCRAEGLMPWVMRQIPTRFMRRFMAFPIMALLGAFAVGAAPDGWAAYLGGMAGTPSRVQARVVSVEAPRLSGKCNHHAHVAYRGATERICVNTGITGVMPRAGDTLVMSGRISRWGLHVDSVQAR